MSRLLEKVEAIEKIGAAELVDQTLDKWIYFQLQKYEQQIIEMQTELGAFEKQFGMTSAEGYRQYESGLLGDGADVMDWMGLYDNVLLCRERIETLQSVVEG
jgi:hypothetical protein